MDSSETDPPRRIDRSIPHERIHAVARHSRIPLIDVWSARRSSTGRPGMDYWVRETVELFPDGTTGRVFETLGRGVSASTELASRSRIVFRECPDRPVRSEDLMVPDTHGDAMCAVLLRGICEVDGATLLVEWYGTGLLGKTLVHALDEYGEQLLSVRRPSRDPELMGAIRSSLPVPGCWCEDGLRLVRDDWRRFEHARDQARALGWTPPTAVPSP